MHRAYASASGTDISNAYISHRPGRPMHTRNNQLSYCTGHPASTCLPKTHITRNAYISHCASSYNEASFLISTIRYSDLDGQTGSFESSNCAPQTMKDDHKGGKLTCGSVYSRRAMADLTVCTAPRRLWKTTTTTSVSPMVVVLKKAACAAKTGPAVAIGSALGRERDILTRVLTVTRRITSGVTEMCD